MRGLGLRESGQPARSGRSEGGWPGLVTGGADFRRPTVLLTTEGTYPYVVGGVSTWCDQLLRGLPEVRWLVLALTAGGIHRSRHFTLPPNADLASSLQLWGPDLGPRRRRLHPDSSRVDLPAALVEGLLGWHPDTERALAALAWCRQHPGAIRPSFRRREALDLFLRALAGVASSEHAEVTPGVVLDRRRALECYQTLAWVARTAAEPTPPADVSLVTAAGWCAIPAAVDRRLSGRPMVLTEHGLYLREAYLAAVMSTDGPAARFVSTRLARGLTRLAYSAADVICPVTGEHRYWEQAQGVAAGRIRPIPNGVDSPVGCPPLPGTATVVSVGRIDVLKDVETMLRVACVVLRHVPNATFLHYGPVPAGNRGYAQRCLDLHTRLQLGDRFRFMGPTTDPTGVLRAADLVLMTSISEGFPMSILEALSQGRPVVSTDVGGVREALLGAGLTAPAGDIGGIAAAVLLLLRDPELAQTLGRRGHERVARRFGRDTFIASYRQLLLELAGWPGSLAVAG